MKNNKHEREFLINDRDEVIKITFKIKTPDRFAEFSYEITGANLFSIIDKAWSDGKILDKNQL